MPDRRAVLKVGQNESIIQLKLDSVTNKVTKSNLVDFFCFWPLKLDTVVQLRKHIHE